MLTPAGLPPNDGGISYGQAAVAARAATGRPSARGVWSCSRPSWCTWGCEWVSPPVGVLVLVLDVLVIVRVVRVGVGLAASCLCSCACGSSWVCSLMLKRLVGPGSGRAGAYPVDVVIEKLVEQIESRFAELSSRCPTPR